MIRIAVVDDDENFAKMYKREIAKIFMMYNVECNIYVYTNPKFFQSELSFESYDLIFMDIDMPKITGIQIASDLRSIGVDTTLVFVSNHDHFVFESFKYSPYRFIRKNNLLDDTKEMISTFCEILKKRPSHILLDLESKKDSIEKVADILYFYSIRHDIFFCNTHKDSIRLAMHTYTMEQLEDKFKDRGFIRIHRSYLLNFKYILRLQNDVVHLKDGNNLPLSRGRSDTVKKEYQRLLREGGIL